MERLFILVKSFCVRSVVLLLCVVSIRLSSQTLNQTDNFQSGTLASWGSGGSNPNPPQIISSGGPAGGSDKYMRLISIGSGAGGKLVAFNSTQWAGNYSTANITTMSMHVKNEGSNALQLRIALINSAGDVCASTTAVALPVSSGWTTAVFSLQQGNMSIISGTYGSIISDVKTVRLEHSTSPSLRGTAIVAQLGVDNITAATTPLPVELVSFTAREEKYNIFLHWNTATEVNNFGFEVEKNRMQNTEVSSQNGAKAWVKIGFFEGSGTTNTPKEYFFTDKNYSAGKYSYRLKQIDRDGKFEYSQEVEVVVGSAPTVFLLEQNYPNPFNPMTTIRFSVKNTEFTTVKVYDVLGREVRTLFNGLAESWKMYQTQFDGKELASGTYVYMLRTSNQQITRTMQLMK